MGGYVLDHISRCHPCRSPAVCHCRTGVAIYGLVSGKEHQPPFLQRFNARVLILKCFPKILTDY
jgi:hypothetical protein